MTYKPFLSALFWNAFNVFLYKIILQTHQVCLFYIITKELFGISGTLFSTMYLLISLTNFGFDYSLFAFHRYYITSQNHFKKIMHQSIVRILIILATAACLLWISQNFTHVPQVAFITQYLTPALTFLLIFIFITESLKKSCELFAQLSFLNKTITLVEITTLFTYISMVWSSYFIRGFIDIYTIFIPMAIASCAELCIVTARLAIFYKTLPKHSATPFPINSKKIFYNQAVNYLNQITKALFSPNFIIIFLAYRLGIVKAGYIKLIIDSIILLYMLLNRAVGISTGALMSQGSDISNTDFPYFKTSFLKITNHYLQFLYGLIIISACAIMPCLIKANCLGTIVTTNILLFAVAGFFEYIIITYEKLFITQGAEQKLAFINLLSLTFIAPALWYSAYLPPACLLLPFILIRLCSSSLIALVAFKTWSLAPSFQIKISTILITMPPSVALLLWHLKT